MAGSRTGSKSRPDLNHVGVDEVPLEHHRRGIRLACGVVRAREVERQARRALVRRRAVEPDVAAAEFVERLARLARRERDLPQHTVEYVSLHANDRAYRSSPSGSAPSIARAFSGLPTRASSAAENR